VGLRVQQLRKEAGLTIEALAYESELGSKGYLSDIERGLALPTLRTLKILADTRSRGSVQGLIK
jgi:transcriptional regulator with XRE-family HTH domain